MKGKVRWMEGGGGGEDQCWRDGRRRDGERVEGKQGE